MRPFFKFILCISILLFLKAVQLIAQPYYFKHYQVENGLSNNAAISALQDKNGFIWIGTKDGLNRFDGYSFKIFRNNPHDSGTIGSNFIHCLLEDNSGTLWIGTEDGLYSYDEKYEKFRLLAPTENAPVADVKMDGTGNLWYIQLFVLYRYNSRTHEVTSFPIENYFEASSVCISDDGSAWVSSPTGFIHHYDGQRNSFVAYNVFAHSKESSTWIEKLVATKHGSILIGTANGAKIFDLRTFDYIDVLHKNNDNTEIFVRNFLEHEGNEIWIASESGIYIYNKLTGSVNNLRKAYNDPYSISDNAVYTFCKDREGGIWAGTYFGGINYVPKQHATFRKYFPRTGENSLSGNVIREIHSDSNGNLWIGTEDAGLNKYDVSTALFKQFTPTGNGSGIAYTNIHGLLADGNKLWIGTFEHGLDVMDLNTERVIRHYSAGTGPGKFISNFIFCITKSNDGKVLIGTTRGAYEYNAVRDEFDPLPGMPLNNWYAYLLTDKRGILWAATYGNGINFYDTKTNTSGNYSFTPAESNGIASNRVNSIYEDSGNTLWFATEGGLSKYDYSKKSFTTYSTKNGFPSNFILSILEDEEKNLWLSTSKGIVCFNPVTEKVKVYTSANGTLNDQFNFNSAFKDKNGRMYFGSVKGMISFQPKDFTRNKVIPPVYITGFQVFNKELEIGQRGSSLEKSITHTKKITLAYDQATFSIDFASLSFTAPEMSEYAYRMEGLDKRWTYLKSNRKAYFTDLSPGSYIFKVKATNSSGLWNDTETSLIIHILPPWWASAWAYVVYCILGVLVIVALIRFYHKRTEERNKRKYELLEIAKEKEIFEAKIEFFTNVAHEIKTPLTLIKAPLEKVMRKAGDLPALTNNLRIMDRNTNRLIELTNQLLDFRQTELHGFSLSFVKANISELLEETYLSFKPLAEQNGVRFQLNLPSKPCYAFVDLDAFKKILYNLFSNAVKYADTKAMIILHPLSIGDTNFTIEIKNDGFIIPGDKKEKIFEPFYRLSETEKQKGTGIGLALSRSLAELHKGTLILKDPDGTMNVFALSLPVHQQNEFDFARNRSVPVSTSNNAV